MKNHRRDIAFDAARRGDLETLKRCIRKPSEANWLHPENMWVMLDAAVLSKSANAVRFLLDAGADPNSMFLNGELMHWPADVGDGWFFSPFASAICDDDPAMVMAFLDAGADLDLPTWIDQREGIFLTCRNLLEDRPDLAACVERHHLAGELVPHHDPMLEESNQQCRTTRI